MQTLESVEIVYGGWKARKGEEGEGACPEQACSLVVVCLLVIYAALGAGASKMDVRARTQETADA